MKNYNVSIPIAGHVLVTVEAENEERAKEEALKQEITFNDIKYWDVLEQFNQGNVCYCPEPWEIEAEESI